MIVFTLIGIISSILFYFLIGFIVFIEEVSPFTNFLDNNYSIYQKFLRYRLFYQCKKLPSCYKYEDDMFWYESDGFVNERGSTIDNEYTDIYIKFLEKIIIYLWPIFILAEFIRYIIYKINK